MPQPQPPEPQPSNSHIPKLGRVRGHARPPAGGEARAIASLAEASAARAAGEWVWIDIEAPSEAQATQARELLGLHPLAVTDCMHNRCRPKQESYGPWLFVVMSCLTASAETGERSTSNLNLFVAEGIVVAVHQDMLPVVEETFGRLALGGCPFRKGIGFIFYTYLDCIADGYMVETDAIEERYETVELKVFAEGPVGRAGPRSERRRSSDVMSELFDLKKDVQRIRRRTLPHRDLLVELIHSNVPCFDKETRSHLRDVLDHLMLVNDRLDSYPEMLTMLVEAHLTQINVRLSEIMKVLSVVSTIILPLTLIAGIGGMNFEGIPLADQPHGFAMVIGVMVLVAAVSVWLLRKLDFI